MSLYDFKVLNTKKEEVSLNKYKGKVLLIVNTATGCGFTPQYKGLEELYKKYQDKGLEILDFPCNQFLNQAPGTNEEVAEFCQINYGVSFETFGKINVNGKNADPLYKYLKVNTPKEELDGTAKKFHQKLKSLKQTIAGTSIKWNFTKFLVNRQGEVVARFHPTVKPEDLAKDIEKLL
ncbi:MAG: glutathione peroxidase [Candidatus Izemoplasmatales bacterium]|jgi:glutathione peroxidase|nr:glutathione peroxidase [Candidatus Izemoplasmatales bacterium]